MKMIKVQIGYSAYMLLTPKEAAPVLEMLSKATLYKSEGYGESERFTPDNDTRVEIGFVDESKIEKTIADLAKEAIERERK